VPAQGAVPGSHVAHAVRLARLDSAALRSQVAAAALSRRKEVDHAADCTSRFLGPLRSQRLSVSS
jgi:hypothetical protein